MRAFLFEEEGKGGGGGGSLITQPQAQPQQQQPNGDPWAIVDPKTGAFVPDWTNRLPDNLKPAATDFAKYPDLPTFLGAAWNAKQLVGKKADGVRVPGPDAKPEEVAAFRKALGVPDKPDGYGIKKPDQLPEGVVWDDAKVSKFTELAHKHGIPAAAVKEIIEYNIANNREAHEAGRLAAEKQQEEYINAQRATLEKEWGVKMAEKSALASRAAVTAGLDPNSELFNDAQVVMAFARIGSFLSEDKLAPGSTVTAMQGPQGQAQDIMRNKLNPYHERYWNGDPEIVAMVQRQLGKT